MRTYGRGAAMSSRSDAPVAVAGPAEVCGSGVGALEPDAPVPVTPPPRPTTTEAAKPAAATVRGPARRARFGRTALDAATRRTGRLRRGQDGAVRPDNRRPDRRTRSSPEVETPESRSPSGRSPARSAASGIALSLASNASPGSTASACPAACSRRFTYCCWDTSIWQGAQRVRCTRASLRASAPRSPSTSAHARSPRWVTRPRTPVPVGPRRPASGAAARVRGGRAPSATGCGRGGCGCERSRV